MKYKLLALDLDGTLLMPNHEIAKETINALKRIISNGAYVTLSTGRAFPSAKMHAQQVGISIPLITYNGAWIRCANEKGFQLKRALSLKQMEYIIDYCAQRGIFVQYYNDDKVIIEKVSEEALRDPDLTNCGYIEVEDFYKVERKISPKMLIVADYMRAPEIMDDLKKNKMNLHIAQSDARLVEIMNYGVSKGSALPILCEHLGVTREETICCGDHINDIEMVKWAGVGAAMANASPELKACADYITKNEHSFGVLEVIHSFFADYL